MQKIQFFCLILQQMKNTRSNQKDQTISTFKVEHAKKIRKEHLQNIFRASRTTLFNFTINMQAHRTSQFVQSNTSFIQVPTSQQLQNIQEITNQLRHLNKIHLEIEKKKMHIYQQNLYQQRQKKIVQSASVLTKGNGYIVYNKILGQGSYSKVYQGEQINNKKKVAVKVVEQLEENEISCLIGIKSPYIIQMFTYWKEGNRTFIVLELCERNLRQELEICSKQQGLQYFSQVVEGMDILFENKIIHRDLKFENILVKDGVAKISDFGLAKPMGSKLVVQSIKCGTPYTMAPQILLHNGIGKPRYSLKCDIWSLGVLLHEIIYRKHPFDYSSERVLRQNRVHILHPNVELNDLINGCLQFQAKNRYEWKQLKIKWKQYLRLGEVENIQNKKKQIIRNKIITHNPQERNKPQIRNVINNQNYYYDPWHQKTPYNQNKIKIQTPWKRYQRQISEEFSPPRRIDYINIKRQDNFILQKNNVREIQFKPYQKQDFICQKKKPKHQQPINQNIKRLRKEKTQIINQQCQRSKTVFCAKTFIKYQLYLLIAVIAFFLLSR